jgi:hypothetical protein
MEKEKPEKGKGKGKAKASAEPLRFGSKSDLQPLYRELELHVFSLLKGDEHVNVLHGFF